MTTQEVTNISEWLNRCSELKEEQIIKRFFPDTGQLDESVIVSLTVGDLLILSRKLFSQLRTALENREISIVLPSKYVHPAIGDYSIQNRLTSYYNIVTTETEPINKHELENIILWLAGYEIEYGLFSISSKKHHEKIYDKREQLFNDLEKLKINYQEEIKKNSDLQSIINDLKDDLTNFYSTKKAELDTITSNLDASNVNTQHIIKLRTDADNQGVQIASLLEEQKKNRSEFDSKKKQFENLFDETQEDLEKQLSEIKEKLTSFTTQEQKNNEHLNFIESKRAFFDERNKYLEELIGREVGASLFETFKQRKKELEKTVLLWTIAVPVAAVATILWVTYLFSNGPVNTSIDIWWEYFALNSIKTVPAVFLLLFAINQYRKERNFQEEYAFKSAVALTIKAYADQLKEDENKDKLIFDAVFGVYQTPIVREERSVRNSKQTMGVIDKAIETINNAISKHK